MYSSNTVEYKLGFPREVLVMEVELGIILRDSFLRCGHNRSCDNPTPTSFFSSAKPPYGESSSVPMTVDVLEKGNPYDSMQSYCLHDFSGDTNANSTMSSVYENPHVAS